MTKPNPDTWEDVGDLKALRDFADPPCNLLFYTAEGQSLSLENWYRGRSVFLVCGGPSLSSLDLSQLRRPGVVTFGVNNVWAVFRPHLWCCVDKPSQFIDTGWKDASIVKFAPLGKIDEPLHVKRGDKFVESRWKLRHMPSVFYYRRNEKFRPDTFLPEGTVNWGCHKDVPDDKGLKGKRSVMLAALKIMYCLGFRQVYIIGSDFKMVNSPREEPARNYAWEQWRHDGSVSGNTATYDALNQRFSRLIPYFNKAKFRVWNCTPGGNLQPFPRMDYMEAVESAAAECEKKVDTEGWYDQQHHGGKKQ